MGPSLLVYPRPQEHCTQQSADDPCLKSVWLSSISILDYITIPYRRGPCCFIILPLCYLFKNAFFCKIIELGRVFFTIPGRLLHKIGMTTENVHELAVASLTHLPSGTYRKCCSDEQGCHIGEQLERRSCRFVGPGPLRAL